MCADEPCMHGATCVANSDDNADFTCQCPGEYTGKIGPIEPSV